MKFILYFPKKEFLEGERTSKINATGTWNLKKLFQRHQECGNFQDSAIDLLLIKLINAEADFNL